MKTIKCFGISAVLALWGIAASAQTSETNFAFAANQTVPDDNPVGLTLTTNLAITGGDITSVTVEMNITGGFNGDLFVSLLGPNGGYAVLMNRVGVGSSSSFGYTDAGLDVTFDDTAANSIHFYQSVGSYVISGGQSWQPDGENIDPQSAPSDFDAQIQNAMLSSLNGTDPNGTWTLFLADLSSSSQSTLVNWNLDVTTVPEPSVLALMGLAGAFTLIRRRK